MNQVDDFIVGRMRLVLSCLVFLTLSAVSHQSYGFSRSCEGIFVPISVRESGGEYIRRSEEAAPWVIPPEFNDPKKEIEAERTWFGIKAPRFIRGLLVEGTSPISHQLKGAGDAGVVKTTSGNMVHLRYDWNGFKTNIGVSIASIIDNLFRSNKSYARKDAKVIQFFVHGGGTKTTGHHVAANIMDFFNSRGSDIIALDLPWHALGLREMDFDTAHAYFLKFREFVVRVAGEKGGRTFVLSGHSMGGVFADMYRRHFPNDTLFDAVIPLSTVADAAPGGTFAQKRAAETIIEKLNRNNPNVADGDLGLMLARAGKVSATCGLFCTAFMATYEWKRPSDNGASYLPALYLVGWGDGLYQNYERSWDEGVRKLAKTELVVYGSRRDLKEKKDKLINIGHLIFDHKPLVEFSPDMDLPTIHPAFPGITLAKIKELMLAGEYQSQRAEPEKASLTKITKEQFDLLRQTMGSDGKPLIKVESIFEFEDMNYPETFVRMQKFIEKVSGHKLKIDAPLDKTDSVYSVVHEYLNNLAFREFTKVHSYLHLRATEAGQRIGAQNEKDSAELKKLQAKKGRTPIEETRLQELRPKVIAATTILRNGGEVTPDIQTRFDAISAELASLKKQIDALSPEALRKQQEDLKKAILKTRKEAAEVAETVSDPEIERLRVVRENAFNAYLHQIDLVNSKGYDWVGSILVGGRFQRSVFKDMPPELLREFEKQAELQLVYQKAQTAYDAAVMLVMLKHPDPAIHSAAVKLDQDMNKIRAIRVQLEEMAKQRAALGNRQFDLQVAQAELIGNEYFIPERYTFNDLLSMSLDQLHGSTPEEGARNYKYWNSIAEKIWRDWKVVWSGRPQGLADADGLY